MKKEDYDSSIKKYSRRKALSKGWYLTKIAGGGILGGVVGNVIGKIYQTERDAVRDIMNHTKNQREKVENFYENQKNGAKNIYEFLKEKVHGENYQQPKAKITTKKIQEKHTRRSFLTKLARGIHEYPVPSLTTIGAGYGAGKMTFRGYEDYRRKMWELEDKLEKAQDRKEIVMLRKEISELKELMQQNQNLPSRLERKADENDDEDYPHFNQALLLSTTGGIGLVISLIFISMSLSGYSVFGLKNSFDKPIIGILIFIISLITILAGLRKNQKCGE